MDKMIDLSHFGLGLLKMGPMMLKFKLGRDFCSMHLPTKFHYPVCYCTEITCWKTHTHTSKQILSRTSTLLHCAMLVENHQCVLLCKCLMLFMEPSFDVVVCIECVIISCHCVES